MVAARYSCSIRKREQVHVEASAPRAKISCGRYLRSLAVAIGSANQKRASLNRVIALFAKQTRKSFAASDRPAGSSAIMKSAGRLSKAGPLVALALAGAPGTAFRQFANSIGPNPIALPAPLKRFA